MFIFMVVIVWMIPSMVVVIIFHLMCAVSLTFPISYPYSFHSIFSLILLIPFRPSCANLLRSPLELTLASPIFSIQEPKPSLH